MSMRESTEERRSGYSGVIVVMEYRKHQLRFTCRSRQFISSCETLEIYLSPGRSEKGLLRSQKEGA